MADGKSLFPSANFSSCQSAQQYDRDARPKDELLEDDSNLENLRLSLPSSTMAAILAAQEISKPALPYTISETNNRDEPDNESVKDLSSQSSADEDIAEQKEKEKHARKRKKKKAKHRHKHKKHKRHHSNDEDSAVVSVEQPKIPSGAVFLDDIRNLQPEHAYHIDRKKNQDLWHYKSISSRHIAKYKPLIRICLGAQHINMGSKNREKSQQNPRYFGKVGARKVRCRAEIVQSEYSVRQKHLLHVHDLDFISIPKSGSSKSLESEPVGSYSCLDTATALYVTGRGTDSNNEAKENTKEDFVLDEIFEKTKIYNQRTRNEPHNVQLWLEFVHFQDVLAQREKVGGHSDISQSHLREAYRPSKTVIEKKLAILEKALEANPSSLEIKLAQLELYQDIWETDKLEKAWEDLLFVHSGDVDLWREYLAKQQCSRLQGFTVSGAVKRFQKCFQTLVSIMDGRRKVIQKTEDLEEKTICLLAQYCDFLHTCGYTERALSTYQAVLEFNLHCPSSLNLVLTKERAVEFEKFWDSAAAKFGEPDAKGWAKWMEGKVKDKATQDVSLEEAEDGILKEQLSQAETWLKLERLREEAHFLPWRPDTSIGETDDSVEDPERLVMFDDISPMLFRITKSESCVMLACLFLKFLGLPSSVLNEKIWCWEHKLGNTRFEQYSNTCLYMNPEVCQLYPSATSVGTRWLPGQAVESVISNVLLQAESYFSLSNRTLFTLLRLELQVLKHGVARTSELPSASVKDVKKFGKSLLKESQNRNNLSVWNSYIRLLWASSDKMSETVAMAETAMAMFLGSQTSSDEIKRVGLYCLCITYCEILLNFEPLEHIEAAGRRTAPSQEDKQQVMSCLGALVENKKFKSKSSLGFSAAHVLKVRNLYQNAVSEIINSIRQDIDIDYLSAATTSFALFEFCATNLDSANAVFESIRQRIKDNEKLQACDISYFVCKNLYLSQLSFITNVIQISIVPRSVLRSVISEGLLEFPNCPVLHAEFIKLEAGSNIAGRLRQFYDKHVRSTETFTVSLFAVVSELTRHERIRKVRSSADDVCSHDTGIVHRLRSVFEIALSRPVSTHSPLLWRLYLNFEFKNGSKARAKGILYRGLQSCPWAKSIFFDGISLFGDAELQEMMDLMTEEEIRVRMPLEELDLLRTAEVENMEDASPLKEEVDSNDEEK